MAIAIQTTVANAKTTAMMIGVALQLNKNEFFFSFGFKGEIFQVT